MLFNSEVFMDEKDLFAVGTRMKLRFPSQRGDLTIEHLWDLPLQSKGGFDLDVVAKGIKRELDAATESSFVTTASPASTLLELKLDILKSIISIKLTEREENLKTKERQEERSKLLNLLEEKKDEKLKDLTEDEIKARLDQLQ